MINRSLEAVSFGNCNCDYFSPASSSAAPTRVIAVALKSAASTVGVSELPSSTGLAMPCCMPGRELFTKETARCRR